MKVNKLSSNGSMTKVDLPKEMQEKVDMQLLAQAIRVYTDRQHPALAKVKTRSEVAISRRKIYRQKGTGGARHGAKSAPIFAGGGVTHGPKGFKRILSLPTKMKNKALLMAISHKANLGHLVIVEGVAKIGSTKEAAQTISNVVAKASLPNTRTLVALSHENAKVARFFRNLQEVRSHLFANLNAYEIFRGGNLVIDDLAFEKKASTKPVVKKASTKKIETKKPPKKEAKKAVKK